MAVSLVSMSITCCWGVTEQQEWLMPFSFVLGGWTMGRDWGSRWGAVTQGRWRGTCQDTPRDGGSPQRAARGCGGSLGQQSGSVSAPVRSRAAPTLGIGHLTGDKDRLGCRPVGGPTGQSCAWCPSTGSDSSRGAERVSWAMARVGEALEGWAGTGRLVSALSPDSVSQRETLVPALPWLAKLKINYNWVQHK